MFEISLGYHAVPEQRGRVVALAIKFVGMPNHNGDTRDFSGKLLQCTGAGTEKAISQQQVFRRVSAQAEFGCQQ